MRATLVSGVVSLLLASCGGAEPLPLEPPPSRAPISLAPAPPPAPDTSEERVVAPEAATAPVQTRLQVARAWLTSDPAHSADGEIPSERSPLFWPRAAAPAATSPPSEAAVAAGVGTPQTPFDGLLVRSLGPAGHLDAFSIDDLGLGARTGPSGSRVLCVRHTDAWWCSEEQEITFTRDTYVSARPIQGLAPPTYLFERSVIEDDRLADGAAAHGFAVLEVHTIVNGVLRRAGAIRIGAMSYRVALRQNETDANDVRYERVVRRALQRVEILENGHLRFQRVQSECVRTDPNYVLLRAERQTGGCFEARRAPAQAFWLTSTQLRERGMNPHEWERSVATPADSANADAHADDPAWQNPPLRGVDLVGEWMIEETGLRRASR